MFVEVRVTNILFKKKMLGIGLIIDMITLLFANLTLVWYICILSLIPTQH
jgi:hypothetical protein